MSSAIPIFDVTGVVPHRDPRTMNWPLAGNIPFLFTTIIAYVYIVKFGGPRFMKNRKPCDAIKPIMLVYNLAMVLLSAYFGIKILTRSYLGGGYQFTCQGINFEAKDKMTMEFLELCWWYLWVRIGDLLDTVFFVLRKKDSHVSFLHVTHHILVVFNGWYGLAYGFDGHVALSIILNSIIHTIMYSYYFLSLLGPAVGRHLWWKRYVTQLQLLQFIVIFAHVLFAHFKDCGYPKLHLIIVELEIVFFFVMFVRFYIKVYGSWRNARKLPTSMSKEE
ncbi:elongation of very long chain fatty acids protein AAEL008004-like [Ixodes scapularis]|uniref:elongation of very long chain fatty acids protein AAEL008004-like n=1 Tax=Ixodes scapularis TaxID=6945 RepID=UPI001C39175D|nr:elongation of very long chain fatty acids protein AAEL008004-like [Ixodes scapularis]